MKKMIVAIMALIISANLYAKDVREFDIKGIKLGMSKSDVLKKMPCLNPHKNRYQNYGTVFYCNLNVSTFSKKYGLDGFWVHFDHKNNIFRIVYGKRFEVAPEFKILYKKIIKKYGHPNKTKTYTEYSNIEKTYCWGRCEKWDDYYHRFVSSYPMMAIHYIDRNNNDGLYDDISFEIIDSTKEVNFNHYCKQRDMQKEMDKRDRASNIDF